MTTPHLIQAGDQMRNGSANQEALRYYAQALTFITADETLYDSVLARRALIFLDLFRGREAIADYARLLHNARRANNQDQEFEWLLGLARAYYLVALDDQENKSVGKMHELCLAARALAEQLGNKRYQVQSLLTTAWSADFWHENRSTALALARQACVLSQELGDEDLVVASKLALFGLAPWHEQVQLGEAMIAELEARQELSRLNNVYFSLMWLHYLLGNFKRAVACCDLGIALANRIGVLPVMYPTLKTCALLMLGRYGEAWASLQQEIADEDHPFSRTFQLMGEGLYYYELSAYAHSIELFEEIVVQAERLHRPWLQSWAQLMIGYALLRSPHAGLSEHKQIAHLLTQVSGRVLAGLTVYATAAQQLHAELALAEGRLAACRQQVMACIDLANAEKDLPHLVTVQELHTRLLLAQGQPDEAIVQCEQALDTATMIDYRPMLWRIHVIKAQALQALKQPTAVIAAYQQALTVIERLAANIPEPDLKRVFLSDPLVASVRLAISSVHFSTDSELCEGA
jgi:tetratricopeptide (TPR) repeat protein